ncbi:hypothetical protein ABDD95_19150 [Mucilaginibacter sp. PAMB04274]|uniref:hypothetical protein n=1 Tax=Mucilaginibacter sp. PAMB04274 TaxID=3138568 RepID=UPI0031F6F3BD
MKSEKPATSQLRLRVFAGPNGSGKSTVIKSIRESEASGRQIDVGVYINADDIARALSEDKFSFNVYELEPAPNNFFDFAVVSGLISEQFTLYQLQAAIRFESKIIKLVDRRALDRVAQLIARFLREALLKDRRRFSFETVFSHESNLEIMEQAAAAGYKVYLYFVSTESPEINNYRVLLRKTQGGHDVPADKITSRYTSSLGLLYRTAQIAYQAFFFDNSLNEAPFRLIGHFKNVDGNKNWDTVSSADQTAWFEKYYLSIARENGDSVPLVD